MTFMSEACNTLNMDKEPGFTLVELLITIVVVSILLAAGVPAFQSFIKNSRVTSQTNDLISTIQLARSEALKRGTNMVVCASSDQATCTGKDTWADGWIVFSDFDPDDGANPDVGTGKCEGDEDCIMTTRTGLSQGSTLTTTAKSLCFLPTGSSGTAPSASTDHCTTVSSAISSVEFVLKAGDCQKNQARKVTVTKQGHTLVSTVACS
jgi:type IV fimbrial biogenesis protein FimT